MQKWIKAYMHDRRKRFGLYPVSELILADLSTPSFKVSSFDVISYNSLVRSGFTSLDKSNAQIQLS